MSNRAIERRLSRLNQGMGGLGTQMAMAAKPFSARDFAEEEQDRNRINLAAELLKIRAEVGGYELADEAPKCLAAAEIIYPELPPEGDQIITVDENGKVGSEALNG